MLAWWLIACVGEPDLPPAQLPPRDPRPDLVLVTIDTLRADRLGAYGDPLARTPVMDDLAAQGVLFRQSHAVTPLTLPSHASLLTGLYPSGHGLRDNGGVGLDHSVETVTARLQASGYATGAFVSAYVLDAVWGLDAGFDRYHSPFHPADLDDLGTGEPELPGAETVNAAASWWRQAEGPRFMWVHLYEPHAPWVSMPGGTGDPYRDEVARADALLGRLLSGVDRDALVVVTSDHGEGLWDQGEREHGVLLGPSITRVPLVVRPPKTPPAGAPVEALPAPAPATRPEGVDADLDLTPVPDAPVARRVEDTVVSGVDVAATLADYGGVELPGVDGRSLRPALEGRELDGAPVYAETWYPRFHLGWHQLQAGQLADVRLERGVRDVWTGAPSAQIVALVEGQTPEHAPRPGLVSADVAARLAALGYLATAAPAQGDLPDPRDVIDLIGRLRAAEQRDDPARTIAELEALVADAPDMVDAHIALALARVRADDAPGALAELLGVIEAHPDHPIALANAGAVALAVGDLERVRTIAAAMSALNDADTRPHRLLAAAAVRDKDPAAVIVAATAGLERAPHDPNLHYLLGLALVRDKPDQALEHLGAAREHGSRASDIALWEGVAHETLGNVDAAKGAYATATIDTPDDPRPYARAGVMLYRADRCEEARPFLVNLVGRGVADAPVREALAACGDAKSLRGIGD